MSGGRTIIPFAIEAESELKIVTSSLFVFSLPVLFSPVLFLGEKQKNIGHISVMINIIMNTVNTFFTFALLDFIAVNMYNTIIYYFKIYLRLC